MAHTSPIRRLPCSPARQSAPAARSKPARAISIKSPVISPTPARNRTHGNPGARRSNSPAAGRTRLPLAARSARSSGARCRLTRQTRCRLSALVQLPPSQQRRNDPAAKRINQPRCRERHWKSGCRQRLSSGRIDRQSDRAEHTHDRRRIDGDNYSFGLRQRKYFGDSVDRSFFCKAAASSAVAASNADASSTGDPFQAIQSAVDSGSVSAAAGQRLENRLLAIARLSQSDPSFDAGAVEDSLLAIIPGWSVNSSGADPSPAELISLAESDGLLPDSMSTSEAVPSSNLILPTGTTVGATATVPEPSTLVLAGLAVASAALAVRKRTRLGPADRRVDSNRSAPISADRSAFDESPNLTRVGPTLRQSMRPWLVQHDGHLQAARDRSVRLRRRVAAAPNHARRPHDRVAAGRLVRRPSTGCSKAGRVA